MNNKSGTDTAVLVVGAGPTGLTLTVELARRGVPVRVIDAATGPQAGSRGKGVQPRSLEVFDDLGVVDDVLAHGRMGMPIRSWAADGSVTVAGGPAQVHRDDVPYPVGLMTPQWRVEQALRSRLAQFGGTVEFGSTLTGIEQDDAGVRATVVTASGSETIRAQWLVGCDGGHSTVRKNVGIAFAGHTSEAVRMIVADVAVDGLDTGAWQMWRHTDGMLALCPLPSTDVFQFQAGISTGQEPSLTLVDMQAIVEARTGRTDVRLHDLQWSSLWRANVRIVDRYREGRILLAGDAAHIHSPAGGQGMNTGIQDAHNLGWKLAAVVEGTAAAGLLDTYATERRPVAASVIALSDERLRRTLREQGIPLERGRDTDQLSIHYRTSPLSRDDRDHRGDDVLRAGDRAPDATGLVTCDGERRFFDLTRGGHFTLLSFGNPPDTADLPTGLSFVQVVVGEPTPGQIVDTRGHLSAAYGATAHTLVLIRPDGYVASISDTGDLSRLMTTMSTTAPGATSPLTAQSDPSIAGTRP